MLLQAVDLVNEVWIALVARSLSGLIEDSDVQEVFILVVWVQHYRFVRVRRELVDVIPITWGLTRSMYFLSTLMAVDLCWMRT